ncbi:MAG TPA: HEPN domain-containing protein [Chloroflexi bacterium]|nr:HEPN domain-containing protein [Chloroflexota bacterium]
MPNRAGDWFHQAVRDLEQAVDSQEAGRHEWACFAAHQAAEKAVKALHLHLGQEAWGHVVAKLLRELPAGTAVPRELLEKARVLDNFYIPSRYPNSHPEGAPFEHYGSLQSDEGLRHAGEIIEFVRAQMAQHPDRD